MGNNGMNCCNAQPQQQAQQVFGKLDVQQQYVNIATGRKGRKVVTILQDFYVPSKTSVRNFSQADLDNKKMTIDGKSISFAEHAKETGSQFFMDGEGRTIIVNKQGSKHVLDPKKNEWVSVNNFYGDKALEVSGNLNHAQKASFIERYGLVMGPNGKYQVKDAAKDSRTYDFDLSGGGLKVRLSEGVVMVDGKPVEAKKPYIFEKGEWRIDEKSNTVLREDLDTETAERKADVAALDKQIQDEAQARGEADTALNTRVDNETTARTDADITLTNGLTAETKARTDADTTLTNGLTAEAKTRGDADTKLTNGLTAEAKARTDADITLTNGLTAETKARTDADTAEAKARAGADITLTNGLTAETKARTDADKKLTTDLGTETTARTDADKKLTTDLGTETTARTGADATLTTNVERVAKAVEKATEGLTENANADEERQCEQEGKMYQLEQENAELAKTNAELAKKIERIQLLLELQQASPIQLQQPPAKK